MRTKCKSQHHPKIQKDQQQLFNKNQTFWLKRILKYKLIIWLKKKRTFKLIKIQIIQTNKCKCQALKTTQEAPETTSFYYKTSKVITESIQLETKAAKSLIIQTCKDKMYYLSKISCFRIGRRFKAKLKARKEVRQMNFNFIEKNTFYNLIYTLLYSWPNRSIYWVSNK